MDSYTTRRSGTVGHEIMSPDGEIIAWIVNGYWAAVIVELLNDAEEHAAALPDDMAWASAPMASGRNLSAGE